jgi:CheY-like chemotaxis protein
MSDALPDALPDDVLATSENPNGADHHWKVMMVDDDSQVHQVTKLALRRFRYQDRRLSFLSAYSGQAAIDLLQAHPDISVILLDIVMEASDAGFRVIDQVRNVMQNQAIQIVVRTGQPGEAPEECVVLNYMVNDYKTKLELTQQKLFTTLVTSLRAHQLLRQLEQNLAQCNQRCQALEKRS